MTTTARDEAAIRAGLIDADRWLSNAEDMVGAAAAEARGYDVRTGRELTFPLDYDRADPTALTYREVDRLLRALAGARDRVRDALAAPAVEAVELPHNPTVAERAEFLGLRVVEGGSR